MEAKVAACSSTGIKVAWRSRVTGAHPLSSFMKIEAYRMFEYDVKIKEIPMLLRA